MYQEIDNLSICYSGVQRIFRNAVVGHIRTLMTKNFPNDHLEKIKSLFKDEEWHRIKENSAVSRESKELSAVIKDDYDLLSVNHFYNIFEKFYSTLIIEENPTRKSEKNRPKQILLAWIKEIKNIRDSLSHPSEADFNYQDSFRLLDSACRVLYRLHNDDSAQEIERLINKLKDESHYLTEEKLPLEDQLPPKEMIVSSFVGRESELKELKKWFDDPLSRRWALSGEGGKGKTAIAYQFSSNIKKIAPEPFVTILWLSAKRKKYVDGHSVNINNIDFYNLDTALSALLIQYGWVADAKKSIDEKKDILLNLLNDIPALVIIDDIDSIDIEDEDAIEFFSFHIPQTKSKILFTSRRILFGMGRSTTHVGSFNTDDAKDFIKNISIYMLDETYEFSKKDIKKVIRITDGSPLFIEDLFRFYISVGSLDQAIKMWSGKNGNEARRYALEREVEMLSADAKAVLIATCVNNGKISFPEIGAITKQSSDQLSSSLQELQKLFLIPKPTVVDGQNFFELNINTLKLVKEVYGVSDIYRRIKSARDALERGTSEYIKGEVGGLIRQAIALLRTGDNLGAELLLKNAIKHYRNSDLVAVLGVVYKRWLPQRTIDARNQFEEAFKLNSVKEDTYEHWCRMEIENLEWSRAIKVAEKGLKKIPSSKLLNYWAGYSCCRLSKDLEQSLHTEKARNAASDALQYFEKAQELRCVEEYRCRELNLKILRGLVLANEMLGRVKAIKLYFREWKNYWKDDPALESEKIRISRKFKISYLTL